MSSSAIARTCKKRKRASTKVKAPDKVVWSRKFSRFSVRGTPLPGVHKVLSKVFYPSYTFEGAIHGPDSNIPVSDLAKGRITKHRPGCAAGTLVDNELTQSVALLHKYNLPLFSFFNIQEQHKAAERYKECLSKSDYKKLHKRLSTGVTRIWQVLFQMRLRPFATQVPVGCKDLKLATAADVVCRNEQGEVVVIEVKTGFSYYLHKHSGIAMQGIQPPIADSPFNQHQLQLLVTYELYRRTFPNQRIASSGLVFRVDCFGVAVTRFQPWTLANISRILTSIQNR